MVTFTEHIYAGFNSFLSDFSLMKQSEE